MLVGLSFIFIVATQDGSKAECEAKPTSQTQTSVTEKLKSDVTKVTTAASEKVEAIQWASSYEDGLRIAKESHKKIFLLFTGKKMKIKKRSSGSSATSKAEYEEKQWCTACAILEAQALSNPKFAKSTKDRFVFIKIEIPAMVENTDDPIAAQQAKEVKTLAEQYDVHGVPNIFVMDADATILSRPVYFPNDPGKEDGLELFLKKLDSLPTP